MMQPGKLNCYVQIMQRQAGEDDHGQPVETWQTFDQCWARIVRPSGYETVRANAEVSIVKAAIRVYFRTDLSAAMRVIHEGTTYEVKAVLPNDGLKEFTDLVCEVV